MSAQTMSSAYLSRLEALKNKHAIIDTRIDDAQKPPGREDFYLKQLKKQRLLIKEEIETMREKTSAASVAA